MKHRRPLQKHPGCADILSSMTRTVDIINLIANTHIRECFLKTKGRLSKHPANYCPSHHAIQISLVTQCPSLSSQHQTSRAAAAAGRRGSHTTPTAESGFNSDRNVTLLASTTLKQAFKNSAMHSGARTGR